MPDGIDRSKEVNPLGTSTGQKGLSKVTSFSTQKRIPRALFSQLFDREALRSMSAARRTSPWRSERRVHAAARAGDSSGDVRQSQASRSSI